MLFSLQKKKLITHGFSLIYQHQTPKCFIYQENLESGENNYLEYVNDEWNWNKWDCWPRYFIISLYAMITYILYVLCVLSYNLSWIVNNVTIKS